MFTNILKAITFLFTITTLLIFFSACSSEEETQADLDLHFNFKVGEETLTYGNTYDINGTAVQIDFSQFYVSDLKLHPDEGDHIHFDGLHLLVKPGQDHYELGKVDIGHYHNLDFNIGVDPAVNAQTEDDFTTRAADDPLAMQTDERMHWNWNLGYIFVKINGLTDTDGDGTPDATLEFHIGTDAMARAVSLEMHNDIEEGENEITINFDLAQLFANIDLSTEHLCHTGDAPELAERFANNVANAMSN